MVLPPQNYLSWKVPISILNLLAIGCAIYRLIHRYLIKRLWWDDYMVIIPLALSLVYWPLFLVRFPYQLGVNVSQAPRSDQILNSFWLAFLPFILIVRFSRIVISLSLARIFPPGHSARRWCLFLVVLFGVQCVVCITVAMASCAHTSPLFATSVRGHHCLYAVGMVPLRSLVLLVDDLIGDLLLVISPLVFFWRLRLPLKERRLILIVFCASALTILSVIAYASLVSRPEFLGVDWLLIIQGLRHIEAGISLLVCNLAVVSTCLYQKFIKIRHQERPELESTTVTKETHRRASSQWQCSCAVSDSSDEHLSTMTLTEISDMSGRTTPSIPSTSRRSVDTHDHDTSKDGVTQLGYYLATNGMDQSGASP